MIDILICTSDEFSSWADLRRILWPTLSSEKHLESIKNLKRVMPYECWITKFNDEFIGFAEASIRPFANGCVAEPVVFLEGIWIHQDHRGYGISKKLLGCVEAWAEQNKIYEIGSDTEFENFDGQKFHIDNSFKETERIIYFSKKLKMNDFRGDA